jgi:hypothetical protein
MTTRIRIFPPLATVYPNDRQLFTVMSEPPPAMWVAVADSGDIKADSSLEVDAAGSQVSGSGGHELRSGTGAIELTIDDQCRPTGSNQLSIEAFIADISGFTYEYRVRINSTTVKVFDETNSEIFTTNHTLASGDVFRVELQAGFRLFMNNGSLHSRLGLGTTVVYPMGYVCRIVEPTATAPTRIPPPRLIGDWQIRPLVVWTPPVEGVISSVGPSDSTEYVFGRIAGRYALMATMEAAADATGVQTATAIIDIPALQILGETDVVLEPEQKVRFKTNYDKAQNKLVAWSVVFGGGSFTQDEYTAAPTPGISGVRATASANGLSADITVTVPPKITNSGNFIAAKPGEQIDFQTNIPASIMPALVGAGGIFAGTGDITPNFPLNLQKDDLMIVFIETANQAVATPPAWTAIPDSPQGTGTAGDAAATRLTAFYRRVFRGNEIAPVITDPGDHAVAQVLIFRGVGHLGDPWDVTSGDTGASSTTTVIPGDTTTGNDRLIVLASSHATDTTTPQHSGVTNPDLANLTEQTDVSTDQGNGGGFVVATGEKATQGTYGGTTLTLANASAKGRMSIALKPAVPFWSASIGSIDSSTGVWTAPSLPGQTAKIAVTNGPLTEVIEIPVLEVFPIPRVASPMQGERGRKVVISEVEDGTDMSRIKDKDGRPRDSYEVQIKLLTRAEFESIIAFWDSHFPGKQFIFEDVPRNLRKVVKFDSNIKWQALANRFDIAFRIRERAGL